MYCHADCWAGCRASDYHSRSTYGDRERKRDRDSERHHSDKPKAAPVAQVLIHLILLAVSNTAVCTGILAPQNKYIATAAMYASFTLQIPNKTETPKERLKRMMAAQINKQVAKDSVKSAQKIAHEEKERKARVQIERMQYTGGRRSPSPERYRSVVSCLDGLKIYGHSGALPQAESRAASAPKHHQPLKHILSPVYLLANPSHIAYREACWCWCGVGFVVCLWTLVACCWFCRSRSRSPSHERRSDAPHFSRY